MESIPSYATTRAESVVSLSSFRGKGDFAPAALEVTGLVKADYYEFSQLPEENAAADPLATGRALPHNAPGNTDLGAKDIRSGIVDFLEKRHEPSGNISGCLASVFYPTRTTASTSNGTRASVNFSPDGSSQLQITLPSGRSIALNGVVNARISEREDGGVLLVTEKASISYDRDGNQLAVDAGSNPLAGTDGNDIIINLNGTEVDGGTGNDTIINFAANASIHGGSGNDKVHLARKVTKDISVDLGDGDDLLTTDVMYGGGVLRVNGGDGNDDIRLRDVFGTSNLAVDGGDGNDDIRLRDVFGTSKLAVRGGSGNDRITAKDVNDNSEDGAVIDGGDGDDQLSVSSIYKGAVRGGSGNDRITAKYVSGYLEESAAIDGGDGDDQISVGSIYMGTVRGGGGKNRITVGSAFGSVIDGGSDGNNEINVKDLWHSLLFTGGGGNVITVNRMVNSMILSADSLSATVWEEENNADPESPRPEDGSQAAAGTAPRMEEPYRQFGDLLTRSTEVRRTPPIQS